MSRFDRAIGLARSLAIYHLIPRRQRSLRALYGRFVAEGALVFDVGAHVGNRTRAFAALGCQVVAVEPQPAVAATLEAVVGGDRRVRIVRAAVSDRIGRARLAVSERTPTVSTLADEWRDQRRAEPGFAGVEWNETVDVATTTLDALIAEYGLPAFVKLDIEGGEATALAGLSQPVRSVSFEFLPQALDAVRACGRSPRRPRALPLQLDGRRIASPRLRHLAHARRPGEQAHRRTPARRRHRHSGDLDPACLTDTRARPTRRGRS